MGKAQSQNVRAILEGKIHEAFTVAADQLFQRGYLDRERRIELSGAIGDLLESFGNTAADLEDIIVNEEDTAVIATKEEEPEDKLLKKCGDDYIGWPPESVVSFNGMDSLTAASKARRKMGTLLDQFHMLSYNIMWNSEVADKAAALKTLTAELTDRMGDAITDTDEMKEVPDLVIDPLLAADDKQANWLKQAYLALKEVFAPGEKPEQSPATAEETDKEAPATPQANDRPGLMIWKDAESGLWRWLGVYSNKFRDDDRPAQIISEAAHKEFVDRVDKGEVNYPDLYIWHIKQAIGLADWVAYDDSGFAVTAGYFYPQFDYIAEALEKSAADLAMSHGMPERFIVLDEKEQVINSYVSTEVSVLPRYAAANKRTQFAILKESDTMSMTPQKQQGLIEMVGTANAGRFQDFLSETARKAREAGVQEKEQAAPETEPAPAAAVADTGVGEPEAAKDVPAAEPTAAVDNTAVATLKQETADMFAHVLTITKQQGETITIQTALLQEMGADLKALRESEEERLKQMAVNTPGASLFSMIQNGFTGSAVGNPAARVDGRTSQAKDGPAAPRDVPALTPVPFINELLAQERQAQPVS